MGSAPGFEVGYRITPRLLAYAGLDINKQAVAIEDLDGDFGLTHLEAGARLSFPIAAQQVHALRRRLGGPPEPEHHIG